MPACFRTICLTVTAAVLAVAVPGCGEFWNGLEVEAALDTPEGVQSGTVLLEYTLSGEVPAADITVQYSTDGGATFEEASMGTGGEGTADLSVSPAGDTHTFAWDAAEDLAGRREDSVVVRVRPAGGLPAATDPFAVHNSRFLAALEEPSEGRVQLYRIDENTGEVEREGSQITGGTDPRDVIFHEGYFLAVHETSNDVTALRLDEEEGALVPALGTRAAPVPVATGGQGAAYLAALDDHVFVAHLESEEITVLAFASDTGALELVGGAGTSIADCGGLLAAEGHLYALSGGGEILILDVAASGSLRVNAASPVVPDGLAALGALAAAGERLFVAGSGTAAVAAFAIDDGGGLSAVSGSPFAISSSSVEQLAASGADRLIAASGADATLIRLALDSGGAVSEDRAAIDLPGEGRGIQSTGRVVAAVAGGEPPLQVWLQAASGAFSKVTPDPETGGAAGFIRLAFSD